MPGIVVVAGDKKKKKDIALAVKELLEVKDTPR